MWASLCVRIEQLLSRQMELLPIEFPAAVEKTAQRIAAQLIEQQAVVSKTPIADEGHSSPADSSVAPVESVDTVEVYLRSFEHFSTARGDVYIIGQTAIDWAMQAKSDSSRARRLVELIRFARFVHAEDERHEIPHDHIFYCQRHRRIPYLFTDQEIVWTPFINPV